MSRSGQVEASPEGNKPFRLKPTKEGDHEPSNSGTQSWCRHTQRVLDEPLNLSRLSGQRWHPSTPLNIQKAGVQCSPFHSQ